MREATAHAGADVYIPGIGPVQAGSELGATVNEQGWVQLHYWHSADRRSNEDRLSQAATWRSSSWYRPSAMDFLHIKVNEDREEQT